jgi:hypothetical protein
LGESPREGNPKPPPLCGAQIWRLPLVGKRQIESKMGHQNEAPEWGRGGGQFCHFSNNSTMKQYFKMLISHEDVYSLPSPYCSVKVCSFPFYVLKREKRGLYSEAEPINRHQIWQPASKDYTSFYRQNLCGGQCTQEQSRPQQHTWNSKLFVIFPAEFTAAQSLHFQHIMWTEVMNSRCL